MSKKISEVSATAAQVKQTESSAMVASNTVRRRKTHTQVFNEGYDAGIRHAAEAMLERFQNCSGVILPKKS